MNNFPYKEFYKLINNDRSLCIDPKRCEKELKLLCGKKYYREINVLVNAIKKGLIILLMTLPDRIKHEIILEPIIRQLKFNLDISQDVSRWVVKTWCSALGKFVETETSRDFSFEEKKTKSFTIKNLSLSSVDKIEEKNLIELNQFSSQKDKKTDDYKNTTRCPHCGKIIENDIKIKDYVNILEVEVLKNLESNSKFSPVTEPIFSSKSSVEPPEGMVFIPAGEFIMGSLNNDPDGIDIERPQHKVYLDDYFIGIYPVTNKEYALFMEDGGYYNPEYWDHKGWKWIQENNIKSPSRWKEKDFNHPDQPVVGISWYEASAYCKWRGGRLPTEAEWEKAARGTDGRKYPWGNYEPDNTHCNLDLHMIKPIPVGQYPNGKSPYGCYDMSGNVWEWVYDCYDDNYYKRSPYKNPKNITSTFDWFRVGRGVSWLFNPWFLRSSFRLRIDSTWRLHILGFRFCQ